jgi:hypothetical protein
VDIHRYPQMEDSIQAIQLPNSLPDPIPEPASMILLMTVIGAVFLRGFQGNRSRYRV